VTVGYLPGAMAAKGSVANIRKKLMSRLSGDDRRNSSAVKPRTTDAATRSTDALAGSTMTTKKDWPLHHQTKNRRDRQQCSADRPQRSLMDTYQNNGT